VPAFSYMRSLYIDWGMVVVGGKCPKSWKREGNWPGGEMSGGNISEGEMSRGNVLHSQSQAASAALTVVRCSSVRPSVCYPSCSCVVWLVSKTVNIFSNVFSPSGILVFCMPNVMAIFRTDSRWGKNRDSRPTLWYDWLTGGVSSVVNKSRPSTTAITASVDFVYVNRPSRRSERNLFLRIGKSEAEVTIIDW